MTPQRPRLLSRLPRRDESGFAMLTVLLAMVILTLLGSVLLANGMAALPQARHQQDFNAALGAAEAGVDDYIARLNQNYNYATNPDGNTAFGTFVPVAVGSPSSYTYGVDTSKLTETGGITLSVTGKTNKVTRTVKVGLRPYGFLDALSQTDYNLVDPALFPLPSQSVDQTMAQCKFHAWQAGPGPGGRGPSTACNGLLNYWVTGNVLDGPMQSNDDFYLCGTPRFNDTVDSGDPSASNAPYWGDRAGCGDDPQFRGGAPRGQHLIALPPSSASLKTKVAPGVSGTGCLYTGPTAITLTGSTMSVVSPDTRASDATATNPNCVGTGVPLPANRTIYVQDIPGTGPNAGPCQITVAWSGDDCSKGDAFVRGTLSDELTIVADNNVVITGNVTYDSFTATNPARVLGLIATNSVVINHPVTNAGCAAGTTDGAGWCNVTGSVAFDASTSYTVPLVDPTVNASLLSLQHSFAVLNFSQGQSAGLGSVILKGSVAGRFMDIEGTFAGNGTLTNGYNVDYKYDARLRNGGLVPPNFLDPAATFWHRVSFTECASGAVLRGC